MLVNIIRRYCRTVWAKKLQTLVPIFTKQWLILQIYISQGSVATQLTCGGMLSSHFSTNFPQNVPVKNLKIGQYLAKIWTKVCGLLFGPPCILWYSNKHRVVLFTNCSYVFRFYALCDAIALSDSNWDFSTSSLLCKCFRYTLYFFKGKLSSCTKLESSHARRLSIKSAEQVRWKVKHETNKGWNLSRVCWKLRQTQLHCDTHSSSSLQSHTNNHHTLCRQHVMCLWCMIITQHSSNTEKKLSQSQCLWLWMCWHCI